MRIDFFRHRFSPIRLGSRLKHGWKSPFAVSCRSVSDSVAFCGTRHSRLAVGVQGTRNIDCSATPSLDNVGFAYRCRSSARRRFPNRHAARKRLGISGSAHAMTAQRISAIQEGQLQPMFDGALEIPSPSPTLLIETHRGEAGRAYTRIIPRHVLTLFLEPAAVRHSADGVSTSHIFIPANTGCCHVIAGTASCSVLWLRYCANVGGGGQRSRASGGRRHAV